MFKDKDKDSGVVQLKSVPKSEDEGLGLKLTLDLRSGSTYSKVVHYFGSSEDFEGFLVIGESEKKTRMFPLSDILQIILEDA